MDEKTKIALNVATEVANARGRANNYVGSIDSVLVDAAKVLKWINSQPSS